MKPLDYFVLAFILIALGVAVYYIVKNKNSCSSCCGDCSSCNKNKKRSDRNEF